MNFKHSVISVGEGKEEKNITTAPFHVQTNISAIESLLAKYSSSSTKLDSLRGFCNRHDRLR